jgi:hypothetical protein
MAARGARADGTQATDDRVAYPGHAAAQRRSIMSLTATTSPSWKQRVALAFAAILVVAQAPVSSHAQKLRVADVVAPILPGERERWSQPRPEPVTLDLPGWTVTSYPSSPSLPNQGVMSFKRVACDVQLVRFWDHALTAGGPAQYKSSRPITVAGQQTQLRTFSMFEGRTTEVQVLWLEGQGYDVSYKVRIRFEHCTEKDLDEVVDHVVVHW